MGFAKPTPPDAAFVQSETVAHRGLLGSQRYHWIHPGGAARRNETRRGGNESEQTRDNDINRRIERIDLEQDVLERGGSDALVDAIVAWGTPSDIRARIDAHHRAGADHVSIQPLAADATAQLVALEELAAPLLS